MRKNIFLLLFLFHTTMSFSQIANEPKAPKKPRNLTIHNHTRVDDYFWMNERDSKDVLEYVSQENKLSTDFFTTNKPLVDHLLAEFESRINPNEQSAPFEINGKIYQVQFEEGKDYPKILNLENGKSTVVIDENVLAKGQSYYDLGDWVASPDNKLLALSEDLIGRRNYTIRVRNFNNSTFLKDKLTETDGSVLWANDNKTLFYVKKDAQTLRSFQVYRHLLGTSQKEDVLVYEEKDEKFGVGIQKSTNNKFIIISVESSTTSESLLINADKPTDKVELFLKREQGHLYEVEPHTSGFYILTNKNAPNKRLVFSAVIPKSIDATKEITPHDPKNLIEDLTVLNKYLLLQERNNGLQKIRIIDIASSTDRYIDLDEETYSLSFGYNDNPAAEHIYFRYNSFTTPSSVYKYDLETQAKELFHRSELIDPTFSPENYESERVWVTANDGTKIPVSIVYKKGTVLKDAPCLLYAYGSYGYTIPDVFSATRLSLLDRGFVFALAHIRGGKYMGEEWYENGKFMKKKNTFTDFINAAEYLGMKGYCAKDKIYAQGGSAGGLLMGAVTNMAPYLFKGVIAQVPFVDVVSTMLDETIPLTVGEYEEWGNPNEEDFYYYMLNYSPYDNVQHMDYPNLLITTGYHDSQVQYWEPLKWIAKLRDYRTNDKLLLLDCNMDAGHGGGTGRATERLEKAKEFAFILSLEGIN